VWKVPFENPDGSIDIEAKDRAEKLMISFTFSMWVFWSSIFILTIGLAMRSSYAIWPLNVIGLLSVIGSALRFLFAFDRTFKEYKNRYQLIGPGNLGRRIVSKVAIIIEILYFGAIVLIAFGFFN